MDKRNTIYTLLAKQAVVWIFALLFVFNPTTVLHLLLVHEQTEQFADLEAESETEKELEVDYLEDQSFNEFEKEHLGIDQVVSYNGGVSSSPIHYLEIHSPPPEA